jgi:hypothetical protein
VFLSAKRPRIHHQVNHLMSQHNCHLRHIQSRPDQPQSHRIPEIMKSLCGGPTFRTERRWVLWLPSTTSDPEIIFTSGHVHTVNASNDMIEAVAVGGGRILAVGCTADIRALSGPGTCEVALHRRSLHPGFIGAHCHLTGLGMSMVSIDCKARGMQIRVGGEVV